MFRPRKVLELLLENSSRSAFVVNASNRDLDQMHSGEPLIRASSSSFVVTVRGDGQTYADLVKAVKSSVDIEKEGLQIISMRKRDDEGFSIRLEGNESTATVLLDAVNKTTGIKATMTRRLECDAISDAIITGLRKLTPDALKGDIVTTLAL